MPLTAEEGDVHDSAAFRSDHVRECGVHTEHGGPEIAPHVLVHLLFSKLPHVLRAVGSSQVVHQDVDPPEALDRLVPINR